MIRLLVVAALLLGCSRSSGPGQLIGKWRRLDGGMVLHVQRVTEDGKVEAVYLNPRPNPVEMAAWAARNGQIEISVKMKDLEFPGSTFQLRLDPKANQLRGEYYQAVEQKMFHVVFEKLRAGS